MFDNEVRATFAAQARAMADQINSLAAAIYIQACQNWAIRALTPPPIAEMSVVASVEFEPQFVARYTPTQTPVSPIKPESFLPTYPTDANAIGGPIGGPIPASENRFYAASGFNPQPGDDFKVNGATYVFKKPTPFGGFWVRL